MTDLIRDPFRTFAVFFHILRVPAIRLVPVNELLRLVLPLTPQELTVRRI